MSFGYLYIFFGSAEVENLLASAADASDLVSIPVLERCTGEGNGNHFSILAWRIPWAEEPSGLQAMGSQRVGHS